MPAVVEGYGMRVRSKRGFPETLSYVKKALGDQGFGVLTEIDVRRVLSKKTGEDLGHEYTIIGACNPTLAQTAIREEPEIGLLLPCNVIICEDAGEVAVSAINPMAMMRGLGSPALSQIASQASEKLRAVVEAIEAPR